MMMLSLLCAIAEAVTDKEVCKVTLKEKDLSAFRDAIEDLYFFEFVIGECLDQTYCANSCIICA